MVDESLLEVIVRLGSGVSTRTGMTVRHVRLEQAEVTVRRGLPVTTPLRTCFDLGARLPLVEAVVVIDAALHARHIALGEFRRYVEGKAARAGTRRARQVVELAEPASESPMESRLRMLLVHAGLPRPRPQVNVGDDRGFLGRLDLYYPEARLGIEYDGATHKERLTADHRRQNRLLQAGITLLRYTAPDVYERPDAIMAEVRRALGRRAAGASE